MLIRCHNMESSSDMKLCSECGHENDVDAGRIICLRCGAKLPEGSLSNEPIPMVDVSSDKVRLGKCVTARKSCVARKRLSGISIHQTSKVLAILYVAIGLLFIPLGVVFVLSGQMILGIVYVLMPFIYGIIGYPLIALMCWLYNMIAKSTGGIEFTIEDDDAS